MGFSDQLSQYAASPSKKVASGWWLAMAATFIVASLFFLNSSVKTPFLFPVFQGLDNLGSRNSTRERSHLYWPFYFSPVSSCCSYAGSGDGSSMDSEGKRTRGIVDNHFGNFIENPKNESFDSKEEESPWKNYSQIDRKVSILLFISRFNSTGFLERMRGKSLVIVGDSLNRNMWESLVCMLRAGVRDKKRVYEISGRSEFKKKGFYAFRFEGRLLPGRRSRAHKSEGS